MQTTNPAALASEQQIRVNGRRRFTVSRATPNTVELTGPRGADAFMVRNVHSGQWRLLFGMTTRGPRCNEAVESVEVCL